MSLGELTNAVHLGGKGGGTSILQLRLSYCKLNVGKMDGFRKYVVFILVFNSVGSPFCFNIFWFFECSYFGE